MHKPIALTLAICMAVMVPANHATAAGAELISEEHYSADGYQVDHYVTRDAEGIISEATLTDPATGEVVDMWTDGETLWWDGTVAGEHMQGSVPAADFATEPETAAFCFTPVTAILCLGVVILAATTCKTNGPSCGLDRETEVPGGAGGAPGDGGDGDGDSGSGGSGGSGGDED